MKKLIKIQFFVLLIATIFGWSNFSIELFAWLNQKACTTGCSLTGQVNNPFLTPCFYGAIFFSLAFILNLLMLLANRRSRKAELALPPESSAAVAAPLNQIHDQEKNRPF